MGIAVAADGIRLCVMMLLKKCRLTLVQTFWWGVFMKLVESGSGLKGFDSG